jgi:hypothetical protein
LISVKIESDYVKNAYHKNLRVEGLYLKGLKMPMKKSVDL